MALEGGSEPPTSLPPEILDFKQLVGKCSKRPMTASQNKFVKKIETIPIVTLLAKEPYRAAMNIAKGGLIGQFTGLWPSPRAIESWVQRNWKPLVLEGIKCHFFSKVYFVFIFECIEDKNLIFRNEPYFMGPQGLYLNKWTPEFDPTQDVPSTVPVCVCLPHLPSHCWSPKTLETIGNTLGK